jgi:hypothetical protein
VQKDPHFLFLLSTTASPTICQAACTIEEGFISDYNRQTIRSYQTIIVDLFLPMSQVGNSKWIPTCHPSKNSSVSERHGKAEAKALDKVWFEKRHRCCTRPGGLASFREHPDEFLRNNFFSVFFCVGVPLPLGWRFVTTLMLADLDSSVFGKTRTIRKISKIRTHCFKPYCLKRSKTSCILSGSSLL